MLDTPAPAPPRQPLAPRPPVGPAVVLGVGAGGFVDGIVLHQILQWHHLLSDTGDHPTDTVSGLEANTLADGLFHAATWLFVAAGVVGMVRAWQRGRLAPPWRVQIGAVLVGWATFNLVEGLVNHHLLGIHHVRDDVADPVPWDVGFLVVSVVLGGIGATLLRRRGTRSTPPGAAPGAARRPGSG